MVAIHERSFEDLLAEAVSFHGHLCPGQVLGVRMTQAGCREVAVPDPRAAGKTLVVIVEIDRCATDAIQALTGVSLGKRTLKHVDFGKMAATFVNRHSGATIEPVVVPSAWLDRRRVRVICHGCGEGVNYEREVRIGGRVLCRACAGPRYDTSDRRHTDLAMDFA